MGYTISNGYEGSEDLQTSVANQEILPSAPSDWTVPYSFYKLSLKNDAACKIRINNTKTLYLRAGQGFNIEKEDKAITSLKILESGITFNWIGAY